MGCAFQYDDNEGFGFDTSTPDRTTETRGKAAPSPAKRTGGATSHTPDKKLQRYAHIKSSGYGTTSPAKLNHARVTWSTSEAAKQKPKSGLSEKSHSRSARSPARRPNCKVRTVTSETGKLGSVADSQLLQSFTHMLQEHLSSVGADEDNVIGSIKQLSVERVKTLMDEITKWQHQYHEQQKTTLELRANMEAMEQDFECRSDNMKTQYKEEISRLKQQNYVLTAKVEQLQKQLSWRALAGQASTEAGNEDSRLAGMEKELEEQEKLITGFQTENERLYAELKKLRVSSKEAEALMFSDNQKLRVDIAMLREELQRKDGQLKNKGLITGSEAQERIAAGLAAAEGTAVLGASRIAQLEVELKQAKLREETYRREQQASGETKRQLELQVDELLRQVRDSEERTSHFASSQTLEAKVSERIDGICLVQC
ncbi:hypothetical protein LSAT2_004222 [Lamellibrachia satsuma]|nr:hypothetical protein LSAT2_004222 [Lamellibrachia satsuma]